MPTLFHVSGWDALQSASVGTSFVLRPGTQCAEGVGVYFSEGLPRLSAAEGAHGKPRAIITIEPVSVSGWWQSKGAKAKKFGKPRTWHSENKHIECHVVTIEPMEMECGSVPYLRCEWQFI